MFSMISVFSCLKLYYEIDTYINPENRRGQYIREINKALQATLMTLHKVLQVA